MYALDFGVITFRSRKQAIGKNAAQDRFVLMMMGVDESRHHDGVRGIDDLALRLQIRLDRSDFLALDQDIRDLEVADIAIESQHHATLQQDPIVSVHLYNR